MEHLNAFSTWWNQNNNKNVFLFLNQVTGQFGFWESLVSILQWSKADDSRFRQNCSQKKNQYEAFFNEKWFSEEKFN